MQTYYSSMFDIEIYCNPQCAKEEVVSRLSGLKVKYWIYTFHAANVSKHITENHFVLCNNFMLVWYIIEIIIIVSI